MEPTIYNVKDLEAADRRALEHVLGQALSEDDRVVITVARGAEGDTTASQPKCPEEVPSWWNIYDGLSDDEIDRLDAAIRRRADFGRSFE